MFIRSEKIKNKRFVKSNLFIFVPNLSKCDSYKLMEYLTSMKDN